MRIVIQRVSSASVTIGGTVKDAIEQGLLVLLGIENSDSNETAKKMAEKLIKMRIFHDEEGKMNLSVKDIEGELLVISQFTLFASTKKGNRPSFLGAARPEVAIPIYDYFLKCCQTALGKAIASGEFGADMKVTLINDGPVTITINSENWE